MAIRRLGQILVDLGYITDEQLDMLLAEQRRKSGELLGKLAESLGLITDEQLAEALAADPANDDVRFDYVKLLIGTGQLAPAQSALAPALLQIPLQLRFEALRQWLKALEFVSTDPRGQWPYEQFDALIAQNKRDFDTRLAKARVLMNHDERIGAGRRVHAAGKQHHQHRQRERQRIDPQRIAPQRPDSPPASAR